jgi:chloramphenicol O-acetyltransferase
MSDTKTNIIKFKHCTFAPEKIYDICINLDQIRSIQMSIKNEQKYQLSISVDFVGRTHTEFYNIGDVESYNFFRDFFSNRSKLIAALF